MSQTFILVHGRVIDKNTQKGLAGVSITIDKYRGNFTNVNGEFFIKAEKTALFSGGLTCSYVGYQRKLVQSFTDSILIIEMERSGAAFPEVVVYGNGKSVLEKAIGKIPLNYPLKPFVQRGVMRVYNIAGDTDYFYKGDAFVAILFPSYSGDGGGIKVKVGQYKQVLLKNPNAPFQNSVLQTRWVGGFHSIPDIVNQRPAYIDRKMLAGFRYKESGKVVFEGRKVFVIEFSSKRQNDVEGTLYIDTATYAFVGINVTRYNIREFGFTPISSEKRSVIYYLNNEKWYIKSTHSESRHIHSVADNNYMIDYASTSLDTVNTSSFAYNDVIQRRDENIRLRPTNDEKLWIEYDSLFRKFETSGEITCVPVPDIDTLTDNPHKKNVLKRVMRYLRNDNVRESFLFSKQPYKINSPLGKSAMIYYSFGFDVEFRIWKGLFSGYQLSTNFGICGVNSSQFGIRLLYNLDAHSKGRPVSTSPILEYSRVSFYNNDKSEAGVLHYWGLGARLGLEWTHKKEIFFSGLYNYNFAEKVVGITVDATHVYAAIGLQFKF